MESMYFLIPLAIALLALAIWAFLWAVKKDQFDGLDSAALSIFDEEEQPVAQRHKVLGEKHAEDEAP